MPWVPRSEGQRRASQTLVIPSLAAGAVVTPLAFTGLGSAGLLLTASCEVAGWLSLYVSAAAMAADAGRPQIEDPDPDAGVVLDVVFAAGGTPLILPPGITWANQDAPIAPTLHGRLRTDLGAPATAVDVALSSVVLLI